MNESVTFFVKATNDRNKIIRCLSSIERQINQNYKIVAFCSISKIVPRLINSFKNIHVVPIKGAKDFVAKLNEEFKKLDSTYCTFVNFDEIVAPNTVDLILSKESDAIIYNIAKKRKRKFAPRFPVDKQLTLVDHIKRGLIIWNTAIKSDIILKNSITLQGYGSPLQALFLLDCFSFADKIDICPDVIAYKDDIVKKGIPTYEQFRSNRKTIGKISNRFSDRGMFEVKEQIVTDFVVSQLIDYYTEKSFFTRLRKKRLLKKYMGL